MFSAGYHRWFRKALMAYHSRTPHAISSITCGRADFRNIPPRTGVSGPSRCSGLDAMIDYTVDATRLQASLAGGGGDLSSNTGSSEIVALGEEVEPLESWDGIFGEYGLDTMAPSGYAGALDVAHDAASPGQSPSQLCLSK